MKDGLKVSADMAPATRYAEGCRTSGANSKRFVPPPGPKAEPVKVNGVPIIPQRGVSK
ncbi:hypothetical protein [Achromobacter aloeverae]|uniref:hypothetical protein n=1 Tax=Achromobacter aloeverae TaxID=1750518 RepID=UPI0026C46881